MAVAVRSELDGAAVLGTSNQGVHDRLSLLACERQGLLPDDLLFKANPFTGDGRVKKHAQKVEEARYHANEMRRRQFVEIVRREREKIVQLLREAVHAPRMNHEQQLLHAELLRQPADCQSNVPEEAQLIEALLLRESDHQVHVKRVQAAVAKATQEGEHEILKIKERQVRSVAAEIELENNRKAMLDQLNRAEESWRQKREARQSELSLQSKVAARRREFKVLRLQERQQSLTESRRQELQARQAQREELERRIKEAKQAELERKHLEAEQQAEKVQHQAERARAEEISKSRLLQHEQEAKLQLHLARKRNLQLRLNALRQMRRGQSAQRFSSVAAFLMTKEERNQVDGAALEEELRLAEERRLQLQALERERCRARLERLREETERAAESRAEIQLEKERRDQALRAASAEKERHLEELEMEKAINREIRKALRDENVLHHKHSLERLRRLEQHQQEMKDALIEEEQKHMQEYERRKRELAQQLHQARLRISKGKERIISQFERLKSSPSWNPSTAVQLIEAELSGSGERPATSASSRHRSPTRKASPSHAEDKRYSSSSPTTPLAAMIATLKPK
jgi:hypothetical protein